MGSDTFALNAEQRPPLSREPLEQQPAVLPATADDQSALHVKSLRPSSARLPIRFRSPAAEKSFCRRAPETPVRAQSSFRGNAKAAPEGNRAWLPWRQSPTRSESTFPA